MEPPRLRLLPLFVIQIGSVVILHWLGRLPWIRVGWTELGDWAETTPPGDAIPAILRVVALAIAYWLLATTGVYFMARLSRIPAAISAVEWATHPAIRRTVDGVVALSLTGVLGAAPALARVADLPPPTIDIGAEELPTPHERAEAEDRRPAADPARPPASPRGPDQIGWIPRPAERSIEDRHPPLAPAAGTASSTVTVRRGDHLWAIAAKQLRNTMDDPVTNVQIADYWLLVIAANRSTLRSGDPDLIYPGETVRLPPVPVGELP